MLHARVHACVHVYMHTCMFVHVCALVGGYLIASNYWKWKNQGHTTKTGRYCQVFQSRLPRYYCG